MAVFLFFCLFRVLVRFFYRRPKHCGSSLTFNLRECMKINKIRLKFHFLTKIEIKMTYLVFFFLVFYCLFSSRAIWKLFYRRLRYLVVADVYKPGNPSKKLRGYMLLVVLTIRIMGFLSGFLSEFLPKFLSDFCVLLSDLIQMFFLFLV